jgi:MinD superfamily P-loop ATPase
MIIAIASGKGGTGKTTLAVNLAKAFDGPVQLLDCDVEEPNAHLFLQGTLSGEHSVTVLIPEIDKNLCDGCGICSEFCEFNAIIVPRKNAIVFQELCHSCGGCMRVCPQKAITEKEIRIGAIQHLQSGGIHLIQGLLDVGVSTIPPLIRAVKSCINPAIPAILDAPPGTSCPVITTLRGVDYVILVTEPTPFGIHDLRLAVEMVRSLNLPFGVVVNRMGIGDDRVQLYCWEEAIPILLEIADDRRIAEAYSRGQVIGDVVPEFNVNMLHLKELVEHSVAPPAVEVRA